MAAGRNSKDTFFSLTAAHASEIQLFPFYVVGSKLQAYEPRTNGGLVFTGICISMKMKTTNLSFVRGASMSRSECVCSQESFLRSFSFTVA